VKKIAIIIPTLNELDNIENLIKSIFNNVPDCTIFFIDDSKNKDIGKLIETKSVNVRYYHRENSSGRGSAVLYGFTKALEEKKFDIFIEMDADFSHNPDELKRHIEIFINGNLDLLIASRYLKQSKIINWTISRRIFSFLANKLANFFLRCGVSDYTNGYRIYSKRAVKLILKKCGRIGDGFIVLSEIILTLKLKKYRINETFTKFVNRRRGESSVNLKLIINSLYGLIKLIIKKNT